MEWISVKTNHFIDLEINKNGGKTTYSWTEKSNRPQEPFLVGLDTNSGFEWAKVVLTENGIEEVNEYDTVPWSWSIVDIEYWMEIKPPTT